MNSDSSQADEIRSPIIASWVLLFATCVLALVPFAGFLAWIIGGVTITIAIILAIVVISKGGTWNGIFILLASLIVVPCVIIIAPIVSTLIAGAALEEKNPKGDSPPAIEMTPDAIDSAAEEVIVEIEKAVPELNGETPDKAEEAAKGAAPVPGTAVEDPPKE